MYYIDLQKIYITYAEGGGGKLQIRRGKEYNPKPMTGIRNRNPKSETKFCQQYIAIKHVCIDLKFGSNVDYRLFFEMHMYFSSSAIFI